jgi:ribosomal protein L11 methyltransferase
MTPYKLIAEVENRGHAMRVAGALQDLLEPPPDALTVFEDRPADGTAPRWRIDAYFSEPRPPDALAAEITALLGEPAPLFSTADIPDVNWVALSQAALPPVQAGRFVVHGSHDRARVPQGPGAILIEAGEAFGTAHHATTYGCLLALDRLSRGGRAFRRVLDLGCGSGILAIAAARAWPGAGVHGVDIDLQSVVVARENAAVNRVGQRIRFTCGAGVAATPVRRAAPFDLVIANILAEPLVTLAPAIRRVAEPGAAVVLSGLLTREAPRVLAAYRAQGFAVAAHRRIDGWSTLTLQKNGSMRGS